MSLIAFLLLHFSLDPFLRNKYSAALRWSTNPGEPLLFVKYDCNSLDIIDIEREKLALKKPIVLDKTGNSSCFIFFFNLFVAPHYTGGKTIHWIDVNPSNGNLLVTGGDRGVNLYDKRARKVITISSTPLTGNLLGRFDLAKSFSLCFSLLLEVFLLNDKIQSKQ